MSEPKVKVNISREAVENLARFFYRRDKVHPAAELILALRDEVDALRVTNQGLLEALEKSEGVIDHMVLEVKP